MNFYLDASVLLAMLIKEQRSGAIEQFLAGAGSPLLVSEYASAEVASALSRLLRTGHLTRDRAEGRLAAYDAWIAKDMNPVDIEGHDIRAASSIVRRFDLMLRAPDALHLAICRRLGATMATLDHRLAAAAQALDVEVAPI